MWHPKKTNDFMDSKTIAPYKHTRKEINTLLAGMIRKDSKLDKIGNLIASGEVQYAHHLMQTTSLNERDVIYPVLKGIKQLIEKRHISRAELAAHMFNIDVTYENQLKYILEGMDKLIFDGDFENAAKTAHEFHLSFFQLQTSIDKWTVNLINSNEPIKAATLIFNLNPPIEFRKKFEKKLYSQIYALIEKDEIIDAAFIIKTFEIDYKKFDQLRPKIIEHLRYLMKNNSYVHMPLIADAFHLKKSECNEFKKYVIEVINDYISNKCISFALEFMKYFKIKKSEIREDAINHIKQFIESNNIDIAKNLKSKFFISENEIKQLILTNIKKKLLNNGRYTHACELALIFPLNVDELNTLKPLILKNIKALLDEVKINDAEDLVITFNINPNELEDYLKNTH